MKMTKYFLLLLSLLWTASTFAQTQVQGYSKKQEDSFDMRRDIRFNPESRPETVIVEIGKDIQLFSINIDGRISDGKLMVEIRNPSNVLHGTFKINTQLSSSYEEDVMAKIRKQIKNPEPGEWKVQLQPSSAKGQVMIITELHKL